MGTDDVRPQDLQRVPCHDDLHKEVPYVHRLSLRGVLIPLETDQDLRLAELLDGLLFFESYPRDFGIREDGVRDRVVIDLHLLFPNRIVKHNLGLVIRDVSKEEPSVGVPEGPDVRLRGREVLIRLDPTVLCQFHTSPLRVQEIGLGPSSGRD